MADPNGTAASPEPVGHHAASQGPMCVTDDGYCSSQTAAAPKPATAAPPQPPKRNPALRMLGLPALPRKLPSRNWLIFWALTSSLSAAIIYDRRETKRATARWARAVAHLAAEPLPDPSAMPRRLTIFLEAPPGDGLRVAQDHFAEYVKPVLAASGLDWEFVQGRQEGDVRAVVAERARRVRRGTESDVGGSAARELPTEEDVIDGVRRRNGITEYDGVKGDVVIGRHTWKEYVRGLHEGWLGPLTVPPEPEAAPKPVEPAAEDETKHDDAEKKEEEKKEEKKPARPPQIKPYNTTDDYPSSPIPLLTPAELAPAAPITFPHILGFLGTPTRFGRFLNRRYLADDIGREVAAVCLATYREFRDASPDDAAAAAAVAVANPDNATAAPTEQQAALQIEERDWVKSVWKEADPPKDGAAAAEETKPPAEKIWARPVVLDPRIAMRMRRFEILPEDEARARQIIVPEEEIEGWIKGSLRQLWRWGARQMSREEPKVKISVDEE